MKYYLTDDRTMILIGNSIDKFPVMPDLEAELSRKGYKDGDEVPVSEFKFVAMPVQQAIEMTEC